MCKEVYILQLCKVDVEGNGGGRGKDNVAPLSSLSGGRQYLDLALALHWHWKKKIREAQIKET